MESIDYTIINDVVLRSDNGSEYAVGFESEDKIDTTLI